MDEKISEIFERFGDYLKESIDDEENLSNVFKKRRNSKMATLEKQLDLAWKGI